MSEKVKPHLAFSIDFEGFVEGMEESFEIPAHIMRYDIFDELNSNLDYCLEFLNENKIEATFFILGWIGEKYPELIKKICEHNHEIASHSLYHKRLTNLSNSVIKEYLAKSKRILEDISGKEIVGFRAPDFSFDNNDELLDYMLELGYRYDSSMVFTNIHDVYHGPVRKTNIFYYENGLIEFPISNISLLNYVTFPVGGGGYLRLYPTCITRYFLRSSNAPICYLHPYELSGNYPKEVNMNMYRRFRHTFNIRHVKSKTENIIDDFIPISVIRYLQTYNYLD